MYYVCVCGWVGERDNVEQLPNDVFLLTFLSLDVIYNTPSAEPSTSFHNGLTPNDTEALGKSDDLLYNDSGSAFSSAGILQTCLRSISKSDLSTLVF